MFTVVQLHVEPDCILQCQERRQTISRHQDRICSYLGAKRLEGAELQQLEVFLFDECLRIEQTAALAARATEAESVHLEHMTMLLSTGPVLLHFATRYSIPERASSRRRVLAV